MVDDGNSFMDEESFVNRPGPSESLVDPNWPGDSQEFNPFRDIPPLNFPENGTKSLIDLTGREGKPDYAPDPEPVDPLYQRLGRKAYSGFGRVYNIISGVFHRKP